MRTGVCLALAISMLAAGSAFAASAKQPTTGGSFLRYRANSAPELASIVKRDTTVASRYAKHFGTTKYGVSSYFGNKLSLIRLRKATTSYVYYYNSRGQVTRGRRVMPAGTLVFATATGDPVLDWRCGNPLRTRLPVNQAIKPTDKTPKMVKTRATAIKPTTVAAAPPDADKVIEKVLGTPPAELAAAPAVVSTTGIPTAPIETIGAVPMATAPVLPAAGAAVPPIVEVAAVPAIAAIGAAPAAAAASHGFASWLLPLAAVGGAVAVAGGKNTTPEPPPQNPVPEPASILALATGFGTLCTSLVGRRRKSRRKTT